MKKIYQNLVWLMTAFCLTACDNFMDVHREYIKDGEKIYAPAVDSFAFLPGREKLLARFWLYNSSHVRAVHLSWNSGRDSLSIPVTPAAERDSVEVILPIPEGSYTFDVRTKDLHDNKSIKVTGFCNSYGDIFQSSLRNQNIGEVTFSPEQAEINWLTTPVNHIGNQVRYTDVNSETQTVFSGTGSPAPSTILPQAKGGTTFEYRSLFLPASNSIDTFYTVWTEYETPFPERDPKLDKSIMSVIKLDSDADWNAYGGSAAGILDDVTVTTGSDNGTFGHTGGGGFPISLTVDLGRVTKLSTIVMYQHRSAEVPFTWVNPKHFVVYGREAAPSQSGDWSEWTELIDCEVTTPSSGNLSAIADAGVAFEFPPDMEPVRYIRVKFTSAYDNGMGLVHISELSFYYYGD
jgi:hypothetical protein